MYCATSIMYMVNLSIVVVITYLNLGSAADLCKNLIWKRVNITDVILFGYTGTANHSTPKDCIEQCRYIEACKSVGYLPSENLCFMYNDRAYSGLIKTRENTEVLYYWALESECPISDGYTLDSTGVICTKYYSQEKSWHDSLNLCRQDNGYLFTVGTQARKNVMTNYAEGQYTYLGATDVNKEDEWNWLSGEPIARDDFIPGRPDNSNGQHCLSYFIQDSGILDDRDCDDTNGFVCEVPFN